MRILPLLALVMAASAAEPAITPIVDARFDGSQAMTPIPATAKNATGSLPEGTKEDSNWADIRIVYEPKDGGVLATMTERKHGEAQLKYKLPALTPGKYLLSVDAASVSGNKITCSITDNGPPYASHVVKVISPKAQPGLQTVECDIPALEGPQALTVRLGAAGSVELRAIRLESKR